MRNVPNVFVSLKWTDLVEGPFKRCVHYCIVGLDLLQYVLVSEAEDRTGGVPPGPGRSQLKFPSLNSRCIVNKVTDLEFLLIAYSPYVVVITETWLNNAITDSCIVPPGYRIFR